MVLHGNQFRLIHYGAAFVIFAWQQQATCCGFFLATSLISLTRRLHVVVFAWQPVQIDFVGGCMLWFLPEAISS